MNQQNLIRGQKPEFGNPEHIKYVKEKSEQLAGLKAVCEVQWEYVRDSGKTTETRKPITYYTNWKKADALQCFIPCPKCNRMHKHVVSYDPYSADHTAQLQSIEQAEITCWNCGLEMFIEPDGSRNVFVKTENNTEE